MSHETSVQSHGPPIIKENDEVIEVRSIFRCFKSLNKSDDSPHSWSDLYRKLESYSNPLLETSTVILVYIPALHYPFHIRYAGNSMVGTRIYTVTAFYF